MLLIPYLRVVALINVSELIGDPDFTQPNGVNVERTTFVVENHRQVKTTIQLNVTGIITIADEEDMDMRADSDVIREGINVFTYSPLMLTSRTSDGTTNYLSDVVLFRGNRYKVMKVLNDEQYGFCKNVCYKLVQDVM